MRAAGAGATVAQSGQKAQRAREARLAAVCGVTRLADITRLDRIGLPVWQAVRPAGRALSVHQGKGRSPAAARLGALMEAAESHAAETLPADHAGLTSADAARHGRPVDPAALRYRDEDRPDPARRRDWCRMHCALGGETYMVPHAALSLDFTWDGDPALERSSGGMGAGWDRARARRKALLERLERDAVGAWLRASPAERLRTEIAPASVPYDWFADLLERLCGAGVSLRLFAWPGLLGLTACYAELHPPRPRGGAGAMPIMFGTDCGADSEGALFGALAEAVQGRLTLIAGARDDFLIDAWAPPRRGVTGVCPPHPTQRPLGTWRAEPAEAFDFAGAARALEKLGLGPVLVRDLPLPDLPLPDPPLDETLAHAARILTPGLGTHARPRRATA